MGDFMGEQPTKSIISTDPLDTMEAIINSQNPKQSLLTVIQELKAKTANSTDPFMVAATKKLDSAQAEITQLSEEQCKKFAEENKNYIGGIATYGRDGIIPRLKAPGLTDGDFDKVINNFVVATVKPKNPTKYVDGLKKEDPVTRNTIELSALAVAIEKKSAPAIAAAKPTCSLSPEIMAAVERALNSPIELGAGLLSTPQSSRKLVNA